MKFLKVLTNKNFLPLIVIFVFALLAARHLVFERGYFMMHDDLQMMRQLQMDKCFRDGQIPCRWVPDMGFGFGFPLFNYYPPLPYLIGEPIHLLGFSFMETVKVTFALSLILSGISMYFLSREFFGRIGGVLSGVFYLWAPYRSVDIFVRGAMNESWSFVFFPLIFLFSYKLISEDKVRFNRNIILLALSYAGLLTSHNIMVMIFTPFFAIWVILHLWSKNNWNRIPQLVISGLLSFGLTAFFMLPVLLEQNLVKVETLIEDYYSYVGHFVSLRQLLISRFWDYGGSYFGSDADRMSFSIGHLHWILSIFVGILLFFLLLTQKGNLLQRIKSKPYILSTAFLLAVGWFSAYMTHLKSISIWNLIPPLKFTQFPWRFLTLVVFAFSFIVGIIPGVFARIKSKNNFFVKLVATPPQIIILIVLSVSLTILSWSFFRPNGGELGRISDEEKFSGVWWELQQAGGVSDYLPKSAKRAPFAPSGGLVDLVEGEGGIAKAEQGTYWVKFEANVTSDSGVVRVNIYKYPNWRIFVDGEEVETFVSEEDDIGRMYFNIGKGDHLVYGQLFNTWPRTAGNVISFITWTGLILYPQVVKRTKNKKLKASEK
jgi:hypothetical protein